MHTQEIKFTVLKEHGIVTKVGKSVICQPGTGSKGSMERLQDVPAMGTRDKKQKG